jgi:hypothetical protein
VIEHGALTKVSDADAQENVTLVIECQECGRTSITFPVAHLATIANACQQKAALLGIASKMEAVGPVVGTEAEVDAEIDGRRRQARWN